MANLSDFMVLGNEQDSDILAMITRQQWRETRNNERISRQACLAERVRDSVKYVSWEVKEKPTIFPVQSAYPSRRKLYEHLKLLSQTEMNLYTNHNTVEISLEKTTHKLHFEQMGMPTASPAQPTSFIQPLTICTDGSWKDFGATSEDPADLLVCPLGSWSAVILEDNFDTLKSVQMTKEDDLTFDIVSYARIKYSSGPISGWHSGRVYICELVAIAAACLCAPANWHIKVVSDSQAAVSAIDKMGKLRKETDKKKLDGYWILKAIIWAVNTRSTEGGSTQIQWIKAHSDADTILAFGNRLADAVAKHWLATKYVKTYRESAYQMTFDKAALSNWHKTTLDTALALTVTDYFIYKDSSKGNAILGNVREEIKSWEKRNLMKEWKSHSQQAIYLQKAGSLESFQSALQLMWKDSEACTFIIMAVTNTLHYGDNSVFDTDEPKEWTAHLICSACQSTADFEHIFGDCGNADLTDLRLEMILIWEQFTNYKSRPGNTNVMAAVEDVSNIKYDLTSIGIFDQSTKESFARNQENDAIILFQKKLIGLATKLWKVSKSMCCWSKTSERTETQT